MNSKNPYEYLKIDSLSDDTPTPPFYVWQVTTEPEEAITVLTAQISSGAWCYGYDVYWASGRHSYEAPDSLLGLFSSQREAELYALGFMALYERYFLEATRLALYTAISEKSQPSLF